MYSHRSYVIVFKRNDKKVGNNPRKTFVKSPMNCRKDYSKTVQRQQINVYGSAGCSCSCSHHRPISV